MNNINKNSNNYYLLNKIAKLKNKRKINFKKNNFLGKNNNENMKEKENSKENKIINNNNADFISTIKKMENNKFNKEKNNKNFLNNLGSFETYFDYGSYTRKNVDSNIKKDYNVIKSINYKNSSYIENNENTLGKSNKNSILNINDNLNKFNRYLDISERYRKINSEFNL